MFKHLFTTAILVATLTITGCAKTDRVDVDRLQKAFATAAGDLKYQVSSGIFALKRGNPAEALPYLQKAFQNQDLTSDQKWALSDALTKTGLLLEKAK